MRHKELLMERTIQKEIVRKIYEIMLDKEKSTRNKSVHTLLHGPVEGNVERCDSQRDACQHLS